ncbi:MAG: sugar phosphate nucleotidyltransferase [Rhodothermales bacterium]
MKLIIPMAGRGTRVRPHSHVTPKPLLHVKGRSMVERIVDTFNRVLPTNLEEGVFVLGPDFGDDVYETLREICARHGMSARFAVQETAEGTAHAVFAAEAHLSGDGIVVFADTVFDMEPGVDLEGSDVVAWVKHVDDPSRFGVAVREGEKIVELVEKPSEPISTEALIGIYYVRDLAALRTAIAGLIDDDVRGKGGEYQLTDAFDRMLKQGDVFTTASVTEWLDCGTIPALKDTTRHILEKERDDLHQGDVENSVVIDPVYIGPGARVVDSVVGPHVSIEAGATVNRSVLTRTIVFAEALVEGAVLDDSIVGQHARVTPSARVVNVGDHSEVG